MRLRPRTRDQAFRAIQALKDPGQEAYLVKGAFGYDAIRICHPQSVYHSTKNLITKPEQLEVKEYQIIA